jgi:signal transduction histidine kinase
MSRLVEGMFEISLLDLHATFAPAARGSLAEALDAVRAACARSAAARAVRLTFAAAEDVELALDVDRLTLIVVNVVDNAIKHGRSGGCVRVTAEPAGHRRLQITVDDDGEGVAPEDRERVFALGARGATGSPGSGIGLAFVRLMLERAGGRIVLAASPLGGARFVLTVPRA